MKAAFYTGAAGLRAQQAALDNIGNNIANVNTNGYKKTGASFSDLLYTRMDVNAPTAPEVGHGIKAVSTGLYTGQGDPIPTGSPLDFAIVGEGFFKLEDGNYTRDGSFTASVEGARSYLVTAAGQHVMDRYGQRIRLERDSETGQFDSDAIADRIAVYQFRNPQGLEPVSGNRYRETALSGAAQRGDTDYYTLMPQYLEQSNVEISDEVSELIAVQRSFQLSARVVQTADEIEQTVNNLRK